MIYLWALISILLGAIAQYLLKIGMAHVNYELGFKHLFRDVISNLPLWGGISCYGLSMVFWLYVLSKMELSKAYPMVSLGYVFTLIIGYFLLNESINTFKIVGILLIVCGVYFITKG